MERVTDREIVHEIRVGLFVRAAQYDLAVAERRGVDAGQRFDTAQRFAELTGNAFHFVEAYLVTRKFLFVLLAAHCNVAGVVVGCRRGRRIAGENRKLLTLRYYL